MCTTNPCSRTWYGLSEMFHFRVGVDWGVRKGKYNMARNNLNVVKTSARQDEISLDEEVIMTVNDFNIQQNIDSQCRRSTRPLYPGL